MIRRCALRLSVFALISVVPTLGAADPLSSWNDTATRKAIIDFVDRVTDENSPDFVPPAERIATFDNDGCLWSEQPVYFQAVWALDHIKSIADDHPEWKTTEPFKSAIAGDMKGLLATGKEGVIQVMMAAHSNITADEFKQVVGDWLANARHPKTGMLYSKMTYRPMRELLDYLRANEFKTYIVSGGGIDFLRVFAEEAYGIPPEQVVGTTIDAEFEIIDGVPTITKKGKVVLIDDKAGKPVGIYRHIGRRPIFAAGNSDGDLQMLQYTTIPTGPKDTTPRFGLIVHHTDGEREFAYDRESHIGKLDQALKEAPERGWVVVDMKEDWNTVFAK